MRILVMYDLPSRTKPDVREYSLFHNFLIKNGFYMIQESIYCCLARNADFTEKIIQKIADNTPKKGDVRCLKITEKQYQEIRLFVGEKSAQELLTTMEPIVEI